MFSPVARTSRPRRSTSRGGNRRVRTRAFTTRRPPKKQRGAVQKTTVKKTPAIKKDVLRFVPLGGLEEVGRNCAFFEYNDEIIIIDVGIQFPEEETPGIDYIIPNITYLEPKKRNIRGIILTHGHYDHVAAIHYCIEKLGNPTIYTSEITKAMVKKRHEEFTNAPKLKFEVVKDGDRVNFSDHFKAEFFNVNHTVPDALGVILNTPVGTMVHFGDFRLNVDEKGKPKDIDVFKKIGARGIHTAFLDSTNSQREGFSSSERTVIKNLEALIKRAGGRVMIATFASLLDRIIEIIKIAEKLGKKVAVNGRSMRDNLQIAQRLGYLKVKKGILVPLEEINKVRDDKALILTTGAQAESNAGLMRIATGEHRTISLKRNDTVIFSSSVVPGNERGVQTLQDNISRQVDELYNSRLLDIHTSGHAYAEDLKLVMQLIKPKFVVPVHGYYFMRKTTQNLAEEVGIKKNRVLLMDNGQVAEVTTNSFTITGETVPAYYVMVDGLGVGDVQEVVLRDRLNLAQEGMVVVITTVDRRTGRLLKNPDIITRGFIYIRENQHVLDDIRKRIRGIISRLPNYQQVESDYLKTLIRDQIGQFLYNKTHRRPMVLPVVIEI